jgi:hypothetical protein
MDVIARGTRHGAANAIIRLAQGIGGQRDDDAGFKPTRGLEADLGFTSQRLPSRLASTHQATTKSHQSDDVYGSLSPSAFGLVIGRDAHDHWPVKYREVPF